MLEGGKIISQQGLILNLIVNEDDDDDDGFSCETTVVRLNERQGIFLHTVTSSCLLLLSMHRIFNRLWLKDVLRAHRSNKKNFRCRLRASDKPSPSLRKISYKYNCMLTYIPVSFLFSFIFRVRVRVKNRVRFRARVRVRDR